MPSSLYSVSLLEQMYEKSTPNDIHEFFKAVHSHVKSNPSDKDAVISFMGSSIDAALPKCRAVCRGVSSTEDERKQARMVTLVISSLMLLLEETKRYADLSARALEFMELASQLSHSYDYAPTALKASLYGMEKCGFVWLYLESPDASIENISYKLVTESKFSGKPLSAKRTEVRNGGTVVLSNDHLVVSTARADGMSSLDACDGFIQVMTPNVKEEKLKISDRSDAVAIDRFAKRFMKSYDELVKAASKPEVEEIVPEEGDKCTVQLGAFVNVNGTDLIKCKIVNSQPVIDAYVKDEELIKGVLLSDIDQMLFNGDYIVGAVYVPKNGMEYVSIKRAYVKFCDRAATADMTSGSIVESMVLRISIKKKKVVWLTANGYCVLTDGVDGYKVHDHALLKVDSCQMLAEGLSIHAEVVEKTESTIYKKFDEDAVLDRFTTNVEPARKIVCAKSANDDKATAMFRQLSMIILSSACSDSLELFRRRMCAMVILNAIRDKECLPVAVKKAAILRASMSLAQGGDISLDLSGMELSDEESDIVDCLGCFNDPYKTEVPLRLLQRGSTSAVRSIAELLLTQALSKTLPDEISVVPDVTRRKVCEYLGVADQFRVDGERRVFGKYGLGENDKVEFKASYVMRNDGLGADLDYQGRGQVFEAVCGFLNKNGGTVYVGVDNLTGNPITDPDRGVNGDMKWLADNYESKIRYLRRNQLGHPVPKVKDLDSFCLFLNCERELYFSESVIKNITISPTEDQDAIRIDVKPSMYEIAYLYEDKSHVNGTAYVRDGNSTMPMSRQDKERRLMDLKSVSRNIRFIITLNEAIDKKRKVILKDYHSGTRGTVSDRFVVPINLVYNDENLYAYDIEEKKLREFRISRIKDIVTDMENPEYTHDFKKMGADVFRWIDDGKTYYHLKARIGVMAMNYLLEEYSNTRNMPQEELYRDPDNEGKWILDTTLHGIGAIRRFYLGLADDIEILPTEDSDAILNEIRTYVKANLS